jgi:hypothetical protein
MGHPPAEGFGTHVDQLDLIGLADEGVRDALALDDASDVTNDVVDAFEVLDVDGGNHFNPGIEQPFDVLPSLGVTGTVGVGVGQFVYEGDLRAPGQDRVNVQLLGNVVALWEPFGGNDLKDGKPGNRLRAVVGNDQAGNYVRPALQPPPALLEHGAGFAHARGGTQVDAELAPSHGYGKPSSETSIELIALFSYADQTSRLARFNMILLG